MGQFQENYHTDGGADAGVGRRTERPELVRHFRPQRGREIPYSVLHTLTLNVTRGMKIQCKQYSHYFKVPKK